MSQTIRWIQRAQLRLDNTLASWSRVPHAITRDPIIFILKGRPAFRGRFSDLKRSIPGISQRMLTATVRNLERDGMLTRHVYAEVPPRVEYQLTPLGRGLTEPVLGLVSWLQSNWPVIRSARDRFDARKEATRTVDASAASRR